ncbi:hypothetical protein ABIF64_004146 [Bradyrhizobium japonicum]|nr:hypothetical protein [Bradyrhizobium japonicum]MCP1790169.1 hypothetical protein [Bradyrhizobium japonicum]MCP1802666.1 hypothetical protein [Bradyrhizobium japonicum]MCP1811604.1 hypothetical protein [Bradyrhizobium japonicum]MCP1867517.1 hypothetical protein [Bradyrhizobium japonicum]
MTAVVRSTSFIGVPYQLLEKISISEKRDFS